MRVRVTSGILALETRTRTCTCTYIIMYEIEAKVPLTKADFQRLKKEIQKIAVLKGESIKKDTYYGDRTNFLFRIREKNGQGVLNIKNKKVEKGIEVNQEIECGVHSKSKFHQFLKKINIHPHAKKEKKSEVYKFKSMQIELNTIKGLGHYLEIENPVKTKTEIPKAKKALRELFSQLGFTPKNFEKKYYIELLEENR